MADKPRSTRASLQHRINALVDHRTRAQARGDLVVYDQLDARLKQLHTELHDLDDTVGETLKENDWRKIMHRGRKG